MKESDEKTVREASEAVYRLLAEVARKMHPALVGRKEGGPLATDLARKTRMMCDGMTGVLAYLVVLEDVERFKEDGPPHKADEKWLQDMWDGTVKKGLEEMMLALRLLGGGGMVKGGEA